MAVITAPSPPSAGCSDEQLLARHAQGDRDALDELFRRYRSVAFRVAYRLLGREADALDAVQEGFIKALTRLDVFAGRCSFKTWLLRVVSNAAIDLGRQRRRRDAARLDDVPPNEMGNGYLRDDEEFTAQLDHRELREALDRALAELSEAQRQTFVLHLDGGLSYREIAEVLGISAGTVMSRLFYARAKLRDHLAHWIEP
jgi:RNA polymerase sigma-70 factor (ECF subfamily)